MAAVTYLSFDNYVDDVATLLTASSTAAGTSVENIRTPNLGKPWRSTATTATNIVIDWGAARNVDRLALIGANFNFTIEQHTADSWGAPTYQSTTQTTTRDPDRRLYRRWFQKTPVAQLTLRYTRIVIPSQTPVDGAPYFSLAALWAGLFTALPNDPMAAHRRGIATPKITDEAALGQWGVSYRSGESFARQHYTRQAEMVPVTPGVGDEFAAWLEIDRQIAAAVQGTFCFLDESVGESRSGVWIMQQDNETDWNVEWPIARDDWQLKERAA